MIQTQIQTYTLKLIFALYFVVISSLLSCGEIIYRNIFIQHI